MNRELKAVLEVYTRKIRTFIDTQISRINTNLRVAYEYLVSRTSKYPVNYDIADRTIWDSEHLLTALTAFSARKISNGSAPNDGIKDGESLVRLLCDTTTASQVTELIDDRSWGTYLRDAQSDITSKFPNLDKLTFGARVIRINSKYIILFNKNLSYLYFPNLEEFYGVMTSTSYNGSITNSNILTRLNMPELRRIDVQYSELGPISRQWTVQIANGCSALKEVLMPKCTYMPSGMAADYKNYFFTNCPNIEKLVLGTLTSFNPWITHYAADTALEKLIHLEFGQDTAISLNLAYWNPTAALDASRTDLIEQGSTAENNLQQFLVNFKNHIALRLTANGSGKTLTLSQAVFSAIWDANGDPQVYQDSPEMTQCCADIDSIMTTKQWEVNKAS